MKKKGGYSQLPFVPAGKIAGTNRVGRSPIGEATPVFVPTKLGLMHGVGIPGHPFPRAAVPGSKGYGHIAKRRKK